MRRFYKKLVLLAQHVSCAMHVHIYMYVYMQPVYMNPSLAIQQYIRLPCPVTTSGALLRMQAGLSALQQGGSDVTAG